MTPPFRRGRRQPRVSSRRKRPERIDDLRQHACLRMRRSNGSMRPVLFDGNKTVEAIVSDR